ncbi:ppgn-1 [Pristionchus pacificus]|nr:ppgn-1 [Pristionchus pacificus]
MSSFRFIITGTNRRIFNGLLHSSRGFDGLSIGWRSMSVTASLPTYDNHIVLARGGLKGRNSRPAITIKRVVIKKEKESESKKEEKNENGEKSSGDKEDDDDKKKKEDMLAGMKRIFAVSLFVYGLIYMISPKSREGTQQGVSMINWSDFVNNLLPTGQIAKIVVFPEKDVAFIYMYAGAKTSQGKPLDEIYKMGIPSLGRFEAEVKAAEAAIGLPPEHWTTIQYRRLEGINQTITFLLIVALFTGAYFLFRKVKSINMSDMMSTMTKTKYNIIDPQSAEGKSKLRIKLKDVAGLHEAKVEINEFVDYIQNPSKYTHLGAKLPKGALLTGPPGCGKTLLAKALAAESSCPFISMNGTEFVEMIGGLGASRIRGLFKEAKQRAPCIIYIDEIDAIGRKRSEGKGGNMGGGGSSEEEQTLNQLLVEMDGMDSAQAIVVLASTNRPDILDKALLRRGRFDRHITIDLPNLSERKEMFELYLKKIKCDFTPTSVSGRLAEMTPSFSGADIANVVNESALRAASTTARRVSRNHLEYALDRVIAGPAKKSRVLVEEEREVVAYHEAGHALVGWMLEHTDALLKVTIIPRTSAALGFAQYSPKDKKLFTREELFDRMCMMLGGRVAESIKFNRITTGAEDDLKKVTRSALAQIKLYGMNSLVGPLSFPSNDEREAGLMMKPYSRKMQSTMDQEVSLLVGQAYRKTEEVIRENMDKLEIIGKELLKREVLSNEDVKKLIGPPPFGSKGVVDFIDTILPKDE